MASAPAGVDGLLCRPRMQPTRCDHLVLWHLPPGPLRPARGGAPCRPARLRAAPQAAARRCRRPPCARPPASPRASPSSGRKAPARVAGREAPSPRRQRPPPPQLCRRAASGWSAIQDHALVSEGMHDLPMQQSMEAVLRILVDFVAGARPGRSRPQGRSSIRAAECTRLPLPLAGRGWGWGVSRTRDVDWSTCHQARAFPPLGHPTRLAALKRAEPPSPLKGG